LRGASGLVLSCMVWSSRVIHSLCITVSPTVFCSGNLALPRYPRRRFKGGQMAANTKSTNYRTLYRMNRAFDLITELLGELDQARLLRQGMLKVLRGYTQELQADINQEVLEIMHQDELDDWGRFGKIRQAEEKRLRDPNDVFIQAEERRKELARQKKKRKQQ
jgi:hypothetical protein